MRIPAATYRLQFNSQFRITDALQIVDYLHKLGVSDLYASPLLKARSGSIHGYDVTDPKQINPEIGTNSEFNQLSNMVHQIGMGILLDIVPNHMAASLENPWWRDVLAHGESSAYAGFFDIDWSSHKVFLPILDKPYGQCLEHGEISIVRNNGNWSLKVLSQELPVNIPAGERLENIDDLDRVISQQPYRLGYWRKAADAINYRRFFDINDLVALRADHPDVFQATHDTVLSLLQRGQIDGLRIDHIDGLLDPRGYLDRLPTTYVVVEKILGGDERLPADWKVHGTTGYDFLNTLNGVFVSSDGYQRLESFYGGFTGISERRIDVFRERKRRVILDLFRGELLALSNRLMELAQANRQARDLTRWELQEALLAVTAALPVYRTYIRDFVISESDRNYIEGALNTACAISTGLCAAFEFVREVLLLNPPVYLDHARSDYFDFVQHWQQFTGPVMAKGLEDTTFYFHNPLISLNEVGSDCGATDARFSVPDFHRRSLERLQHQPHGLNATETHDTKRAEDARARINVLSELREEWADCIERWGRWNPSTAAPDANEQVFIYQTLIGAWPVSRSRLHIYLIKALREAKTHTNWLCPDERYEQSVLSFVDRILSADRRKRFLRDFLHFQNKTAFFGAINSLSQTLLKITSPGVPDFYQGSELWDFSLADPDNRRLVDYQIRMAWLDWLKTRAKPEDLLSNWSDGRIKMFLIWKALNFRRAHIDLFHSGDYIPLQAHGPYADNIIAFARRKQDDWVVVVVPRLSSQLTRAGMFPLGESVWSDTVVDLPEDGPRQFQNVFTGAHVDRPAAAEIFANLPFALLEAA
jgi:(1->4)-alpha-D-glucan 1-alpha-D-glucosylmutase